VQRRIRFVVATVLVLVAAGCGSDPALTAVTTKGATLKAVTLDNVFTEAKPLRVAVDDTVDWVNQGKNHHDIVSDTPGAFGVDQSAFAPGDHYAHTFSQPGVYRYYCSLHGTSKGGMIGTILVGNVAAPAELASAVPTPTGRASGRTITVPGDQPTIQKAVDASGPGDLILLSRGTYREAVIVPEQKSDITIRGLDRNKTILEGDFTRENGIKVIKAGGVVVENLTMQDYTKNGVFWTGVKGYRGSYLNAYRNGDYGIYGFQSTYGVLEHSYASGSPDAGFYIGGCYPCNSLINDVTSEWNGLGYSGTNSSGNLVIANSTFRYNRSGIVPNSGSYEPLAPERENTIVGNLSYGNGNDRTPAIDIAVIANGFGIIIAGGSGNVIRHNRVIDNPYGGIVVFTYPEGGGYTWDARNNTVTDNIVAGSTKGGDLGFFFNGPGKDAAGNCFANNTFGTSTPDKLEQAAPCTGKGVGDFRSKPFDLLRMNDNTGRAKSVPYDKAKTPPIPPQPQMPAAATAAARPAPTTAPVFDVSAVTTPAAPAGL